MKALFLTILVSLALLQVSSAQTSSGQAMPSAGANPQSQSAQSQNMSQASLDRITREVRHELLLLPYYGIFDNLSYRVNQDGSVTLMGQVSRPVLKSDAENAVKHVEGVERVDNQIEVLPTSPMDDQIRIATYRAIYGNSTLSPYSLRAVPPIHIIVKNGHVTLEGVVANQMDKQIAGQQANSVPNVFSVTNNLRVESGS